MSIFFSQKENRVGSPLVQTSAAGAKSNTRNTTLLVRATWWTQAVSLASEARTEYLAFELLNIRHSLKERSPFGRVFRTWLAGCWRAVAPHLIPSGPWS